MEGGPCCTSLNIHWCQVGPFIPGLLTLTYVLAVTSACSDELSHPFWSDLHPKLPISHSTYLLWHLLHTHLSIIQVLVGPSFFLIVSNHKYLVLLTIGCSAMLGAELLHADIPCSISQNLLTCCSFSCLTSSVKEFLRRQDEQSWGSFSGAYIPTRMFTGDTYTSHPPWISCPLIKT